MLQKSRKKRSLFAISEYLRDLVVGAKTLRCSTFCCWKEETLPWKHFLGLWISSLVSKVVKWKLTARQEEETVAALLTSKCLSQCVWLLYRENANHAATKTYTNTWGKPYPPDSNRKTCVSSPWALCISWYVMQCGSLCSFLHEQWKKCTYSDIFLFAVPADSVLALPAVRTQPAALEDTRKKGLHRSRLKLVWRRHWSFVLTIQLILSLGRVWFLSSHC